MTDEFDDLKPFLTAKGLSEDRIAEIEDPQDLYQSIAAVIASIPKPMVGEDAEEWWTRVRQARAGQFRVNPSASNVVSMADWKGRSRVTLVLKTYGELLYGAEIGETAPLPEGIVTADGYLRVYFEAIDGTIKVDLETNNLFALEHYGNGRSFQIVFGDPENAALVIDRPIEFDSQGLASISIPDTLTTRRHLGRTNVFEIQ